MQEVSLLLNAFPQARDTDPKGLLYAFGIALEGLSTEAIIDASRRYIAGKVDGQSKDYAPTAAQFADEARRRQEVIEMRRTPRLERPVSRPSVGVTQFQIRRQKALNENANRPVIKTDATHEEFKAMSAAGKLPAGASWIAILSTIYGPEPTQLAAE